MKGSIKTRVERLLEAAQRVVWRPHTILLTGQPGDYVITVREWDGVPGSARCDGHTKEYLFERKTAAVDFANSTFPECEHRFDLSILVDEEWNANHKQTVLEERAEKDGKPLREAVIDVYGCIPDFWVGILEKY